MIFHIKKYKNIISKKIDIYMMGRGYRGLCPRVKYNVNMLVDYITTGSQYIDKSKSQVKMTQLKV